MESLLLGRGGGKRLVGMGPVGPGLRNVHRMKGKSRGDGPVQGRQHMLVLVGQRRKRELCLDDLL